MAEALRSRSSLFERLVLVQVGLLIIVAGWAFGGQSPLARTSLTWLGTIGIVFFLWSALRDTRSGESWRAWRWIWPLLLFDVFTLAATFNPSFRSAIADGQQFLVQQAPPTSWLPSCAVPAAARVELWLLNGLIFSAYNLTSISSRRSLRILLAVLGANAVLLAIFGTFQKLLGAPGIWYGLVPSPNEFFFATFVYHNHWGAFALLHSAMWAALLVHHLTRPNARDVWHSPMLAGAVGALLLAVTAPLSGSRSSTVLLTFFLLGTAGHCAWRIVRARQERRLSATPIVVTLIVVLALAAGAVTWLARPMIDRRARQTARQIEEIRRAERHEDIARVALYRDTWRMAADKPWFGWGLESYSRVFQVYNTQRPPEPWFRERRYAEAHNDWLQSLAENGFVGTTLLVLLGALPLVGAPLRRAASPLPRYLLAGIAVVLLYAAVEFPFANPAVLVTFWTVLYLAVRYARLDAHA